MKRLLVVHHSPSPQMAQLLDQVLAGANTPEILGVDVSKMPALTPNPDAVLAADAYLLGTPANLGYMSGALKHFFDVVYNDVLAVTPGRPFGFWIHGHTDVEGARLAIEKITTGLGWRLAQEPVLLVGDVTADQLTACWELGAAMAAPLSINI